MGASIKTPMTLAFTLGISLFALPALGAPAYDAGYKSPHHRVTDLAEAYVSPVTPVAKRPETDGLSRDGEECSRGGCIDH
jgi:hypothetical protein